MVLQTHDYQNDLKNDKLRTKQDLRDLTHRCGINLPILIFDKRESDDQNLLVIYLIINTLFPY